MGNSLHFYNVDICPFSDLGPKKPIPFKTLYPTAPKKALDLLSKMLEFVPGDRLTVEKALQHPYLSNYHDPDDEPVCIPAFNFDFEKEVGFLKMLYSYCLFMYH